MGNYEMTDRDAAILSGKHPLYDGFGELHSAGAWAQLLLVDRSTLWRNLQRGVSVEDFAKARGITYPDPRRKNMPQAKERGKWVGVTAFLIRELLLTSGYDAAGLEILPVQSRQKHLITCGGTYIGAYDYIADCLTLSGGDAIKLAKPIVENLRIVRQAEQWHLHPETKSAILAESITGTADSEFAAEYAKAQKKQTERVARRKKPYKPN